MLNYSFKTPLSILIILAILVYSFFIYQTIFYIDGHLYFTLVDDAMISMNYAKHLADGHGIVWNIGDDPIQGFSNLGWMLYMSLIHLLPVDPSKISLLIMITSIFILISLAITIYFITYGLYRTSKQTAFLATIITIFYFPLVYWSLRGMEVGLVTLFIYLSIYFAFKLESIPNYLNALKLGVLMFCAVITRFDSSAQISLIVLYLFITGLKNGQLKLHSIPIIFFIFSILGLFTFQYFYFGDMLPNTYQLKVLGVSIFERIDVGLDVFFDYAFRDFSALFFIVIGGLLYYKELRTYKITLLLGLFLIQVFYSIYVGGDYAEPYNSPQVDAANRFITQGMPALFVIFSIITMKFIQDLVRIKTNNNFQINFLTTFGIGFAALAIICAEPWYKSLSKPWYILPSKPWYKSQQHVYTRIPLLKADIWRAKLGVHINQNTSKDTVIAAHATGQIPYFSNRRTIDMLGISDSHIANSEPKTKFRSGHNKWDYNYSIGSLLPDLVADEWGNSPKYLRQHKYYKKLKNRIWIRRDSILINIDGLDKRFNK